MKRLVFVLLAAALAMPAAAKMGTRPAPNRALGPATDNGLRAADRGVILLAHARQTIVDFLGLSEAQATSWDVLAATLRETAQPLEEQLRGVERQLHDLLAGENPDPAAVGALVIQEKGLRDQIGAAKATYVQGFAQLLDSDQQTRFAFVRRASRAEPLFPAFRAYRLLPPPGQAPPPPAE